MSVLYHDLAFLRNYYGKFNFIRGFTIYQSKNAKFLNCCFLYNCFPFVTHWSERNDFSWSLTSVVTSNLPCSNWSRYLIVHPPSFILRTFPNTYIFAHLLTFILQCTLYNRIQIFLFYSLTIDKVCNNHGRLTFHRTSYYRILTFIFPQTYSKTRLVIILVGFIIEIYPNLLSQERN